MQLSGQQLQLLVADLIPTDLRNLDQLVSDQRLTDQLVSSKVRIVTEAPEGESPAEENYF